MGNFGALKSDIESIVRKSKTEEDSEHSIRTLKWLLKIKPEAGEALKIAALAHDIDRAAEPRTKRRSSESYSSFKRRHAKRSAQLISNMMEKNGYNIKSIKHVARLVESHETGGGSEANALRDADSVSYFDYNIRYYFKREGPKATSDKIRFMYARASPRCKKLIKNIRFSRAIKTLFEEELASMPQEASRRARPPRKSR